jgi:hypothetical protein
MASHYLNHPSGRIRWCVYRTVNGWAGFVEGRRYRVDAGEHPFHGTVESRLADILEHRADDLH